MAFILLFQSTTQLYEAESILTEKGIANQIISVPELPENVEDTCGDLGLLVEDKSVAQLFDEARLVEVPDDILDI